MSARPAAMPYILMYHSVAKYTADPLQVTVSPERFTAQMRWLARRGLRGVSVRELQAARRAGAGHGLVGLTFDDGYTDFAAEVVPVLLRHRFTATVFAVAGSPGGHNEWDAGHPRKELMNREELRWVAGCGMEVGSHSLRHVSLPTLDPGELAHELAASKEALEDLLGAEVTGFAYPYGHAGPRETEAVRAAGYGYACAIWKSECSGPHALARTYVGERDGSLRMHAKRVRHRMRWGVGA